MKVIIFLLSVIFLLSACGKNQVKSSLEENTTLSDTEELAELTKYFSAIVVEEGVPKCKVSLEGRFDLAPSFADVYPEGDPVYSKSLVSLESAKQMTEEQREDAIVVPDDVVALPDCSVEEETSIAQMAPDMMLIDDGTEEEVASVISGYIRYMAIPILIRGNAVGCVVGAGTGWGIANNQMEGASLSNVLATSLGSVAGTIVVFVTSGLIWNILIPPVSIPASSLGLTICGAGAYSLFKNYGIDIEKRP